MRTYFFFDVSGSMSSTAISMAIEKVNVESKSGDHVIFFDCDAYGPYPVEDALGKVYADPEDMIRTLCDANGHKGRGGTDPELAFKKVDEHARAEKVRRVLVSDGMMMPERMARFDAFIEVDDRKAQPAAPSA